MCAFDFFVVFFIDWMILVVLLVFFCILDSIFLSLLKKNCHQKCVTYLQYVLCVCLSFFTLFFFHSRIIVIRTVCSCPFVVSCVPSLIEHMPNTDYATPNYESNNAIRAKSKLGFLENLNAKLAEQRLSGKAFAVRNIINSKALVRQLIL